MKKAVVNESNCDGSPFCPAARSCPKKAFDSTHYKQNGTWSINKEVCIGCGICLKYCPQKAISLVTSLQQ